jgi:hypothetical protein
MINPKTLWLVPIHCSTANQINLFLRIFLQIKNSKKSLMNRYYLWTFENKFYIDK